MDITIIDIVLGCIIVCLIFTLLQVYQQKNQLRTKLAVIRVQLENETKQLVAMKAENEQAMNTAKVEWEERMRAAKEEMEKQICIIKSEAEKRSLETLSAIEKSFQDRLETQKQHYKEALSTLERSSQDHIDKQKQLHDEEMTKLDKAWKERMDVQEDHHKRAIGTQQEKFDETIDKMTAQLKLATDEMLKQRQQEFAESSNTNLGQIVNPLKETIDQMKQVMSENTLNQTALSSSLSENIKNMMLQSEAARKSTDELTRVFKHGSKVQGDWGETVLNELLEAQGLTEGVHYELQPYIRDAQGEISRSEEGSMMRPDVILHLDQRREVIIDSKVSLTAYMDYVNAETEAEREKHLKAHVESINKHVKELASKDYSKYIQKPKVKMDYVIMFVPNTGALLTALNEQPDLWRKAMAKNVYIADEQTLYAALRIINLTWTQITQIQNHEQVYKLANVMLDRVGLFMKRYQAIGKALDTAQASYNEGLNNLKPDGKSIIQTCNQLIKLGAKQSGKNPLPQLIDIDDVPAIEAPGEEEP